MELPKFETHCCFCNSKETDYLMDCFCQACTKCATAQSIGYLKRLKSQSQNLFHQKDFLIHTFKNPNNSQQVLSKNLNTNLINSGKNIRKSNQFSGKKSKISNLEVEESNFEFEVSKSKIEEESKSVCASCGKKTEYKIKNIKNMGYKEKIRFISKSFLVQNYLEAKQKFLIMSQEEIKQKEKEISEINQSLNEIQNKNQYLENLLKDLAQKKMISLREISPEIIFKDSFGILDQIFGLNCSNLYQSEMKKSKQNLDSNEDMEKSTLEKKQISEQETQFQKQKISQNQNQMSFKIKNRFATPPKKKLKGKNEIEEVSSGMKGVTNVFTNSKKKPPFLIRDQPGYRNQGFFTSEKKSRISEFDSDKMSFVSSQKKNLKLVGSETETEGYGFISSQKRIGKLKFKMLEQEPENEDDMIMEFQHDLNLLSSNKKNSKNKINSPFLGNETKEMKNKNTFDRTNYYNNKKYSEYYNNELPFLNKIEFHHTFRYQKGNQFETPNPTHTEDQQIQKKGRQIYNTQKNNPLINNNEQNIKKESSDDNENTLLNYARNYVENKENMDPNRVKLTSKSLSNISEPNISNLLSKSSNTRSIISQNKSEFRSKSPENIRTKSTLGPGKIISSQNNLNSFRNVINFDFPKNTDWNSNLLNQKNKNSDYFDIECQNNIVKENQNQIELRKLRESRNLKENFKGNRKSRLNKNRERSYNSVSIPRITELPGYKILKNNYATQFTNPNIFNENISNEKNFETGLQKLNENCFENPFDEFFSDEDQKAEPEKINYKVEIDKRNINNKNYLRFRQSDELKISDLEIEGNILQPNKKNLNVETINRIKKNNQRNLISSSRNFNLRKDIEYIRNNQLSKNMRSKTLERK